MFTIIYIILAAILVALSAQLVQFIASGNRSYRPTRRSQRAAQAAYEREQAYKRTHAAEFEFTVDQWI